jgi:hypothetical protein
MPEKDTALGRWGGRLVLWVVLPYAALVVFYLVAFRLQVRRLNDAVCFFNKRRPQPPDDVPGSVPLVRRRAPAQRTLLLAS